MLLTISVKIVYLILLLALWLNKKLHKEIWLMLNLEEKVKKEIENLYVLYRRMRWEKVCLLILSLLPPGKFASTIFICNKMQKWHLVNPENKNRTIKSISSALHDLHTKRLVVREDIRINIIGERRFRVFCESNKEGEIIEGPPVNRSQSAFRLLKEGEKVNITIPPKKMRRLLR